MDVRFKVRRGGCSLTLILAAWVGIVASPLLSAATSESRRPTPPPLASLPLPKAAGPLRVLIVDDDWSSNNATGTTTPRSAADTIVRELVQRVAGELPANATIVAWQRRHGPSLEQLRPYNLIVWYNGGSYGGDRENTAVLSLTDEDTVRNYLQEVGGAVLLLSPGYLSNHQYGSTWTASRNPFLREVLGIDGSAGLVQRFKGGRITDPQGTSFTIADKGAVETQFSAANATTAAVVFRAALDPARTGGEPAPVATAHAFGAGRLVYVGFSVENVSESERESVFRQLVQATGLTPGSTAPTPPNVTPVAITAAPTVLPSVVSPGIVAAPPLVRYSEGPAGVNRTSQVKLDRPPPGPPLINLRASSSAADAHAFWWETPIDSIRPKNTNIFVKQGDQWVLFAADQYAGTVQKRFILPNSVFQIVCEFVDGSVSEAELTFARPIQPKAVESVSYEQVGTRTIKLTWQTAPWEQGDPQVRVFAEGLPPEGVLPNDADRDRDGREWLTIANLPEGVHTFRVAYRCSIPSPVPDYAIDVTVAPRSDGYRFSLIGFRAEQTTPDESLFGGDGRGEEVYFGMYRARHVNDTQATHPPKLVQYLRTVVLGDVQGFPTRQPAGTLSPQGGIRAGDVVPSDAALVAQPGRVTHHDRLPWLLWEGRMLDEEDDHVAIGLTLFEWDNGDETTWRQWSAHWTEPDPAGGLNRWTWMNSGSGRITYSPWSLARNGELPIPNRNSPEWVSHYHHRTFPAPNRPIGAVRSPKDANLWYWMPYGFTLSHRLCEAMLGTQEAIVFGVSMATKRGPEMDEPTLADPASYLVYFQLERTPPVTAQQMGGTLGPWVVVRPKPRPYTPGPNRQDDGRAKFGKNL